MLQSCRASQLLLRSAQRALSCCAAAAELQPPQPGSVAEYDVHVLIRLPVAGAGEPGQAPAAAAAPGSSWPELIEKEPAVLAGFQAVAQRKQQGLVSGTVKITAFQELEEEGGSAQQHAQQLQQQQEQAAAGAGKVDVLAFPAGTRWAGLTLDQVGLAVALAAADNPNRLQLREAERRPLDAKEVPMPDITLLVCCHAARDARCGARGPPLAAALQQLVRQRGLAERVQVLATSHIGGHKYAGNVVCYGAVSPCDGDWFGGVHEGNAEEFLDALLGVELGVDGGAEDPALRPFWRGRMGLSKEEQLQLFESGGNVEDLSGLASDEEEWGEEDEEDMSASSSDDEDLQQAQQAHKRRP